MTVRTPCVSTRAARALSTACVVLALASGGCARAGGEAFQPSLNQALPLAGQAVVGQTFTPAGDVVTGVDVLVATFAADVDPDGMLRVTLRDRPGAVALATATVPGAAIPGDGTWVAARFGEPAPVTASAAIELSWDGMTPLAVWANVPPTADATPLNDPYPGGQLLRDGRAAPGDLAFRVRGAGGAAALGDQAVEVLRSTVNRLLAVPGFSAAWTLALAGAVALAVAGLRRPSR